jgi:hypothetical protein
VVGKGKKSKGKNYTSKEGRRTADSSRCGRGRNGSRGVRCSRGNLAYILLNGSGGRSGICCCAQPASFPAQCKDQVAFGERKAERQEPVEEHKDD